jgi:hypothetical protein
MAPRRVRARPAPVRRPLRAVYLTVISRIKYSPVIFRIAG